MKQLVLSGNRVVAHGEDCFFSAGGAVICSDTGRIFENATVANIDCELPSNIDEVGYEYHAGEFVPCAPFGKGGGNIAVVCNEDCKSIKDSGINFKYFARDWVVLFDNEREGDTYSAVRDDNKNYYYDLSLSDDLRNYGSFCVICWLGTINANGAQYIASTFNIKINNVAVGSQTAYKYSGDIDDFDGAQYAYTFFPLVLPTSESEVFVGSYALATNGAINKIRLQFSDGSSGGFKANSRIIVVAR